MTKMILIEESKVQQALDALEQMYQRAASAEAQEIPTADLEAISVNAGVSEDIRCEAQEVVFIRNSIAALREATAQPEQEPVATVVEDLGHDGQGWCSKVRWLCNPVPEGETLSWGQPK